MKNLSREKAINVQNNQNNQLNANKLNKTQVPPKPAQNFQNTYYGQRKNVPVMQEKPSQQLPPRINSTQKMQYKVSDNMTNSNIHTAKQGLQLLKKKMSRNGMSRQKRTSVQKRQQSLQQQIPKKTMYKAQDENEYNHNQSRQNQRNPPKLVQKRSLKEETKSPPIPTKANMNNRKSNQQYNQYRNQIEEAPLKANQDFDAILERQLAKQRQMGNVAQKQIARKPVKMQQYQQENQEVQLEFCREGCGRKFNINALEKHQKICKKVFQQKRKAFNAAEFRAPEVEDFKMPPPPTPPQNTVYKPERNKKQPVQEQKKIPKWKLQSAAFRAGLKQGRGQQLSKQEQKQAEMANPMKQCPCCGRKFNEEAAKRHFPICQQKSKQLPKMNTTTTKKR